MSGSGISWNICKSAPRSRQITMPIPHHSVFYRPDALPAAQPTASKHWRHNWSPHTHTHTHLTALFPGLPGWAGTRKVKPIWILLKQETVSASGISWAICKSASRSRQITMPAPHHSVFTGRMLFLPPNQQRQSTEGNWSPHEQCNSYRSPLCSKIIVDVLGRSEAVCKKLQQVRIVVDLVLACQKVNWSVPWNFSWHSDTFFRNSQPLWFLSLYICLIWYVSCYSVEEDVNNESSYWIWAITFCCSNFCASIHPTDISK